MGGLSPGAATFPNSVRQNPMRRHFLFRSPANVMLSPTLFIFWHQANTFPFSLASFRCQLYQFSLSAALTLLF